MPSPPPRTPHEAPKSGRRESWIRRLADAHRDHPDRHVVAGHHNINYVVPLGWCLALLLRTMPFRARVKCRMPRDVVEVVPRIWPSETELLAVVSRHLEEVPRCLRDFGDWALHSYRAGRALSEVQPTGPVGPGMLRSFAEFFARAASVPARELPPRPVGWPESGQSREFLHWLIDYTDGRVHGPNRWRFEDLFTAVGVRRDAITAFRDDPRCQALASRPFCLLHTDVHRANVVVDRKQIAVIDWELAMYGDPLHDLATHLVRMEYDKDEHLRMRELWTAAMEQAGHVAMTRGMEEDLPVYLDFEYAQSVFPDIMRAALDLAEAPEEAGAPAFAGAAVRVCRALRRAAEPLRLAEVPEEGRAERALRDWYAGPFGRALSLEERRGPLSATRRAPATRPASAALVVDEARDGTYILEAREPGAREPGVHQPGARELKPVADLLDAAPDCCVLFGFDGPLCRLYPDGSSRRVADELRKHVRASGYEDLLTPREERTADPHDVLRALDRARPGSEVVARLQELLTAGEARAALTASRTPGAAELVRELRRRQVRIAVVTDNSPRAVAAHLHRSGLSAAFGPHIYGRTDSPSLLEPHPDSLERALNALGAEPADALMIGNTATEVLAARNAKVLFVGHAHDEAGERALRDAGAEVVVPSLDPLLGLLGADPS
ncbi:phosphotransferase [Streptomyces sp. NPDC005863]|uniref:phosphotransferase n=1 Tax=unclassified Streptomyces TaxID=2593676 RepID=UPI0033F1EA7B